jgi:NADH:ubiquinone oxidoreductase subunit
MKGGFMVEKKHFSYNIIILLIVLILILSGCIPLSDEAEITYLINRYYHALSKQNWDKARSYCVYNSDAYNDVTDIENNVAQWSSAIVDVTLDYSFYIEDIVITGNYATVNGILRYSITVNGSIEEYSGEKTINVEKINNNWKLK